MKKTALTLALVAQLSFATDSYFYFGDRKIDITPCQTEQILREGVKCYELLMVGSIVGVGDQIIVKTKEIKALESYAKELNASIIKPISKDMYLIKANDRTKTIDIANRLHEKEEIEYAQPDFVRKVGR
ncbi:S8 family serine peptidase [Hydrogenimonas thermophila]|uniref:Fervidolysin-like N-terminal prodomain domain-containing protein n=1 Tax=Hydrogenimonas thermophila TaxID=223786 RepID=A0A1I5UX23_9BACT|nr:hypothetical protein [Hydrogenimonas thermophila]SFP99805.1 hypothetical protein SAMN05216234_1745 [Hydrogenimonas thermophila]